MSSTSSTSPTPTATPAQVLLQVVSLDPRRQPPTDAMADKAWSVFIADIASLDQRHNGKKSLTQDQLAEQIFRRSPIFKDAKALVPYLRYQLRVAFEELTILNKELRSKNNGSITFAALSQFREIIHDYLFDLKEILDPLQKNVPGWSFFQGGKNPGVDSWEVYLLAKSLAYQSTYLGTGTPFDHKTAQIASIFVLRQAMELRFERLIAVYPLDPKGKPPKLRHGFHQEFIAAHPNIFRANGFQVKQLRHLYDWTSEIVHQVYQPYAWQISMAIRRGGDLLRSRQVPLHQAWSIHNAVQIDDVEAMQSTFEDHFLANYGHGTWQMTREKPEAFVPTWKPELAFTGSDYRSVTKRPGRWSRLRSLLRRKFSR